MCRKILARWVGRDINPIFAGANLLFAYKYNLKEGLPPAIALLKQTQTPGDAASRVCALLLVGRFGSKDHIALLEPFLKDTQVYFDTGGINQPIQVQIRDIALVISIKLAGQDPKSLVLIVGTKTNRR